MELLANWLVQGGFVALATAVVLRCLRRARAQARYWVCMVSWSAVLVLPLLSFLAVRSLSQPVVSDPALASAPLVSVPHSPMTGALIVVAWAVWVVVNVVRLANAAVRIRRVRKRARAFPPALEARLSHWTRVRARRRSTRLLVSNDVRAAAVIGCGSPTIAVAPALIRQLTADELDRVVVHEWAHVQRRDDLIEVAQRIAQVFAGWHPAAWWLGRQLHLEREAACDEMAVALTGSSKRYAACLLKVAGLPALRRELSYALGMLSSPAVSTRIERVVHSQHRASPAWSMRASWVGIVLLAGASCAVGSLRVVQAAHVSSSEHVPARAIAQPALAPPAIETARAIVAAVDSPTRLSVPRKASPRPPVATSAAPRIAVISAPDPAANTTSLDVLHDPAETEEMADGTLLNDPTGDPPPAASPQVADTAQASPWAATANAGISLGTQSKKGGVAAAAFFTRLGKRIAGSF